ncbi:MAG: lipoamide dehydrogenase [Candidatus Westeberhardia cardiocondylae]|nr:lipoamide dehydrogenase [Candidatus Westeberhardia cardiocondylae]
MHVRRIKTQVAVIGSGPGGYSAAFRCSDLNLQTALVERYSSLGGICLNVGCIPSKTLLHIANIFEEVNRLHKLRIIKNRLEMDINYLKMWKEQIVCKLSQNLQKMMKLRRVNVLHGNARFIDDNTLEICRKNVSGGTDSNSDDRIFLNFDHAIIAAGSRPVTLPMFSGNDSRIWNSSDALSLKFIPKNMLIVGGGVIGLEIASIYYLLGSKIDVVEVSKKIISFVDDDIVRIFTDQIRGFFNVMPNTQIISVESREDAVYVEMKRDHDMLSSEIIQKNYDVVLVAVGRVPNKEFLLLDNAGIMLNSSGFISVDEQMCTNISHIYAVGDMVGVPMLAHKSIYEGRLAAEVIGGKKHFFSPKVIPSIIYTIPEIGWVGITEKEAKKQGIDYGVSCFPWFASGKAVSACCQNGMTKLIFDKFTNRIIGGAVVGINSSELLGEITLAIEMGCDAEDIALTMHAHPTLHESISLAAELFQGTSTDLLNTICNSL